MQRIWLIFSQAVAVCLALLFVLATLRPVWVKAILLPDNNSVVNPVPTATVKIQNPEDTPTTPVDGSVTPLTATIVTSYADAVKQASPSVVNIYTTKDVSSSVSNLPDVPALRPFIQEQKQKGLNEPTDLGSGVIASSRGYILTNYHVVQAADAIEVALSDGRKFNAKYIGADPDTDLAVLHIDAKDLQAIRVNEKQNLNVGDVVLAIGNPFGVGQTTTMGIISALGRTGLGINTYENFIQTDAAINPGNSGGALINVDGSLIGINTAIYSNSDSGGSLGIGFATPAATALKIMDEIITTGEVKRGWMGLEPQDLTTDIAKAFNLKETRGVIIASILPNGPADKAGLMAGDIIVTLNNQAAISINQIMNEVATLAPEDMVKMDIMRSGKKMSFAVTLGVRPKQP